MGTDMRPTRLMIVVLLLAVANVAGAQTEAEKLVAESDPTIQAQINATYSAQNEAEAYREVQTLKKITDDKDELVKQLAIFATTTESEEEFRDLHALRILHLLELPPSTPIRVLAPYLDAENEKLRGFALMWFNHHDSFDRIHGRPPLGSVNYDDYKSYVGNRLARNEEIPAAFIEFIYERHPGKALLVFVYANRALDAAERLYEIRKRLEARKGIELKGQDTQPPHLEARIDERERREILLTEHNISDAIWLKENKFAEQFQNALPEASAELAKLAQHKEWWVRLYVAWTMRKHRELRQPDVLQELSVDTNALVRKAADPIAEHP